MMSMIQSFGNHLVRVISLGDSHPGRGRNRAAAEFLKSGCEYLLFIDADIIFNREHIDTLMASDEPILCGVYPVKEPALRLCAIALESEGLNIEANRDQPVPVKRAGTGFMRIHRSVFESLKHWSEPYRNHGEEQWDFFESGVRDGEWLSEDWFFCDKARDAGFRVMLHLGIQLHHEGTAVYPLPQMSNTPKVPKSWRDIGGWFDFAEVYERIAKASQIDGKFVEVGAWMGKSIAFMASIAPADMRLYAVDTFKGSPEEDIHRKEIERVGGDLRAVYDANLKALGLADRITTLQLTSLEAAATFRDGELDGVFIDAAHTFDSVKEDIEAWLPKVRAGGILAGHDYDDYFPGVKIAVNRVLGEGKFEVVGKSWYFVKP